MRTIVVLVALLLLPISVVAQTNKPGTAASGATEVMCGLKTYQDSLTLAFQNAAGTDGETLVTVQVLPSFQREYAVILKRTPPGIKLLRATLRSQLWTQHGPPLHIPRTRQECLEIARAAEVDTVAIPASAEQVDSLWATFTSTSLQTDSCARRKGKCEYFQDGTDYVIQPADGRSIRVSEVAGTKDVVSENPALLDWMHSMLQVLRESQEPPRAQ